MPRARNPAREQAREMWVSSGKTAKLRDIASKLGVPEKTVSAWKAKDKWGANNERSTPKNERSTPKRKRGGQPGNTNSTGAPLGNKNGEKTGAYSTVLFSTFDEEEMEIAEAMSGKRETIQHQITILAVREHRMMKRLQLLRAEKRESVLRTTTTKASPTPVKDAAGNSITKVSEITTNHETIDDRIVRVEDALTRVQAELRRYIDSLRQLDEFEKKYGEEKKPDDDDTGCIIYLPENGRDLL